MNHILLALALCGLIGALIYSFPAYLKNISRKPPVPFATISLAFSLFVGSVCAALFTRVIGYHWPWTTEPEPFPLAVVIGLASNPLVPHLIRKLEGWVENFGGKNA